MKTILVRQEGGVCEVVLHRPESLNALNEAMIAELSEVVAAAASNPAIRCLLLKGSGAGFMAGGDIKMFHRRLAEPSTDRRQDFKKIVEGIHPLVSQLAELRVPVVAAVHGAVAGFGVSLTLLCDFVLAADDSFFTLAYVHLGTTPDGSSTFLLPRIVGLRRAKEIALLGDRIPAQEAVALGLAFKVTPRANLDAEAAVLAGRLAASPTHAYARTKALLHASFGNNLEEQLEAESSSFAACAVTEDFTEGVNAFLERRKPRFNGRG